MKKFNLFLMCGIFVTAFIATGCDEPSDVGGSFISLDVSLLEFDSEGGSLTATVSSDGDWTVDIDGATWYTVSHQSGSATDETVVTVTVTRTESFAERTGVVTFASGTHAASLTVSQGARILQDTDGVVINDVRWATRNVDAAGTFAANPHYPGRFYQWNRRVGYVITVPLPTSPAWNNVPDSVPDETWLRANDPCPTGWRVPTTAELESLLYTNFEWVMIEGVNGKVFVDKITRDAIFLPAMGWRNRRGGGLANVGERGLYWSTPVDGDDSPSRLIFTSAGAGVAANVEADGVLDGFNVRCVAE